MGKRKINTDKIKSSLVASLGLLLPQPKSPDEALGELFDDVQSQQIYDDNKIFVDLIPKSNMKLLQSKYIKERNASDFNLRKFVERHFNDLSPDVSVSIRGDVTVTEYITNMWDSLERRYRSNKGSLIALPHKYIVPGGRFNEQFYWDSYFIMLGLISEGRINVVEGMVKNFVFMMRKFGFIPTGNRTYFLSRSQPPLFCHMARMLAHYKGESILVEYLPYLLKEYRFWMKGRARLAFKEDKAFARLVQMPDGSLLNRYFDNKTAPRPDAFLKDVETANRSKHDRELLYLNLRAAAESGWDFSSRWLTDPHDITSIHTVEIIPVDLNCLIYQLESTIADAYHECKQFPLEKKFRKFAEKRKNAILKYCWNEKKGFFMDYDFHKQEQTGSMNLAGIFPLFAGIATYKQADRAAKVLKQDFLKNGGLVTTLISNSQQWDSPNGWAPLHFFAVKGLRNYGYFDLASEIKRRWVKTNINMYESNGKLLEKYNVIDCDKLAGGGEYALQDGFGWTNGVLEYFLIEDQARN